MQECALARQQLGIPGQQREQLRQQKPGEGDQKGPGFLVERGEDFLQDRFCWLLKASPPKCLQKLYDI